MSGTNAGSLADLQRAFQDYLLSAGDGFAQAVRDTKKVDGVTLLAVYRDAYASRLIEVLTNDYPGVMAMCGPADFDYLARSYVAAHPSRHPSVRWFGRNLAEFAATTAPFNGSPAVAEMALFEWALGDAFDARDVEPIAAEALMAIPPEAWETLRFTVLPSMQRLALKYEAPQAWQRRDDEEPGNLEVPLAEQPLEWAIWRPERLTNFRSLEADEAILLDALIEGRPFPEMCEAVVPLIGEETAMARAAGLLRGWVEAGMLASFTH